MDIAIWGTGNFGKYIQQQIKENDSYHIKYFVDRNSLLWGTQIDGIEVISPEQLKKIFSDELEFVLIAFTNGISTYETLLELDIDRFGIVRNRIFEAKLQLAKNLYQDRNIFWSNASYLNKPLMKSLETNIVDDCNLNCRGCSHFSNLFKRGEMVPFDTFCKDLRQVSEHVYIYQFNMLGGEALLNDRITDYICFVRKTLPDSEIQLVSNGLLIPKQSEAFFKCCKENNVIISISGYKPTLLLKNEILRTLEKNHVTYSFRTDVVEFGKNIDLTGTSDKYEAMKKCRENKCHFLRYGKIYKCPFEALGNRLFEHYHLDITFNGGTDIYDKNLDWNILLNKLSCYPVDACRYCGKEEKIEWRVANSPVLEDWVVKKEE